MEMIPGNASNEAGEKRIPAEGSSAFSKIAVAGERQNANERINQTASALPGHVKKGAKEGLAGESSSRKRRHRKKKHSGTKVQTEQDGFREAVLWIERMDSASLILADAELMKDLLEDLKTFLRTGKVTYFHAEEEVSCANYNTFLRQLERKGKQILLSRSMRSFLYTRMEQKIIAASEPIQSFLAGDNNPKQTKRVRTLIKSRVYNRVVDPCVFALCEKMTISDIRECLFANPRYKDAELAKQQQEAAEQVLTANILREIPEYYPDLYPAARLMKRHFILHIGPTNSGKTYDAIKALENAEMGIYLGPLRLLAHEIYERLTADGIPCRMKTGEEDIAPEVRSHQASTIEMLDTAKHYNTAVIDEIQMIADRQRGRMWTAAILGVCAETVHLCGAPEAESIVIKLIEDCGDSYEVIRHERSAELVVEKDNFTFPEKVQAKDALIVFSKRNVLACAAELQSQGISCSIIYGALPYDVRKEEVRKFSNGETKVVVATDAIGMGMNLPIRRVVFLESEKFDGISKRPLRTEEILQIGGRAGRRGLYDVGYINAEFRKGLIRKAFKSAVTPIERVALPFPESLLGLDGNLSDIFTRWGHIQQENEEFNQTDLSVEIKLCQFLEKKTNDKELIYKFITMPFDEDNLTLFGIWDEMADCEIADIPFEYKRCIPQVGGSYSANELAMLEEHYQICDLLCYYLTRFGHPEEYEEVSSIRSNIAVCIMEVLSKQELIKRKCRSCGKPIKWNSPYNICSECYEKHMRAPF